MFIYSNYNKTQNEEGIQKKIATDYPVISSEVDQLRIANRITTEDVLKFSAIVKKNFNSSNIHQIELNYDQFKQIYKELFGKSISSAYLFDHIAKNSLYEEKKDRNILLSSKSKMTATEWLLILSMISTASMQERLSTNWEILDSENTGKITREQFLTYIKYITRIGWCYDVKMYKEKKAGIWTEYEVCLPTEFAERCMKAIEPEMTKAGTTEINLELFRKIPIKLI